MTASVLEPSTVSTHRTVSVQIAGAASTQQIEPSSSIETVEDYLKAAVRNDPSLSLDEVQSMSPVVNGVSANLETHVPDNATLGFMPRVQNG